MASTLLKDLATPVTFKEVTFNKQTLKLMELGHISGKFYVKPWEAAFQSACIKAGRKRFGEHGYIHMAMSDQDYSAYIGPVEDGAAPNPKPTAPHPGLLPTGASQSAIKIYEDKVAAHEDHFDAEDALKSLLYSTLPAALKQTLLNPLSGSYEHLSAVAIIAAVKTYFGPIATTDLAALSAFVHSLKLNSPEELQVFTSDIKRYQALLDTFGIGISAHAQIMLFCAGTYGHKSCHDAIELYFRDHPIAADQTLDGLAKTMMEQQHSNIGTLMAGFAGAASALGATSTPTHTSELDSMRLELSALKTAFAASTAHQTTTAGGQGRSSRGRGQAGRGGGGGRGNGGRGQGQPHFHNTYCYFHGTDRGHPGPDCNRMAQGTGTNPKTGVAFTQAMVNATCQADVAGGAP
jgi:hypothetical protein